MNLDLSIKKGNISIKGKKITDIYTSDVAKSGNSARINCQRKYLGKKVLVIVLDDETKGKRKKGDPDE